MTATATPTRRARNQAAVPVTEPGTIAADESFMELVAQLQKARADAKDADLREKDAKAKILERLGKNRVAKMFGVVVLRVSARERRGINAKLLAEAFPEAYQHCSTVSSYDVIEIAH